MISSNNLDNKNVILPLKKKGRKSKQTKLLELEELEKNKIPVKLFPTLNEKIFDLVELDGKEYFLDLDFGTLYNNEIMLIGIKKNDKFMLYDEIDIRMIELQINTENNEIIEFNRLYKFI